ncbi:MAPEG family protein [Caenimonas sp. DR4.4]|uniref:MAPEG family protein n=2 Tax=Caenimonas aquaedulcis TaxID=2793270 RepID=A0A931H226_9BURK|nr:MAPEG family protein [Caenimonas aquaedulcis]
MLPYACAWIAKSKGFGKPRREGGFDNHDPRAWLSRLTDWQARANAAQANSFEALPFFIGAVIIAHQLAAQQAVLDILALLFVTLRVIYIAMYVAGLPTVRSAIWALALLVNVGILFLGWR